MPPKPEPNYAQRAQNCEQESAALRLQIEYLSNVDNSPSVESARYLQIINDQEQELRQNQVTITAMRSDLMRATERAESAVRRAQEAEGKLFELESVNKQHETFMTDLRYFMRGRL